MSLSIYRLIFPLFLITSFVAALSQKAPGLKAKMARTGGAIAGGMAGAAYGTYAAAQTAKQGGGFRNTVRVAVKAPILFAKNGAEYGNELFL